VNYDHVQKRKQQLYDDMKTIWRTIGVLVLGGALLLSAAYATSSTGVSPIFTVDTRGVGITSPPQSQTTNVGANVTFTVAVAGVTPFGYQWQFNGNSLAGQTATNLSLNNVQFINAGGYSVVVTNAYGSATSAVAQLTVYTNLVLIQTNRTPKNTEIGSSTIPTNPNYFKVFTNGNFVSSVGLNPNKNTVVLTHGWRGSPSDWAAYTAQIIQQRIGINAVNIVAWDWTADATSSIPDLGVIAAKTPGEGTALGTNLVATLGANYSKRLHFVGHSLGTLVNGAAADYVHAHGFAWTNTQMTLCDEAEAAWELDSTGWQMATTLPKQIGQAVSSLVTLSGNFSTPQPYWNHPLPQHFAWADNYITACGLLHPEAANAILNFDYPATVGDMNTFIQEFYNFHDYAHYFYEDTIEPGIFNTGGQLNATYMGFICSFEGGGSDTRPVANTYFYQDPNGLELNLVQKDSTFATTLLNARLANYWSVGVSSAEDSSPWYWLAINSAQVVGQVSGIDSTAGIIVNLLTGFGGSGSQIQSLGVHPMGGPVPLGGSAGNTPAYAWIPLTIPSNAVSMSFDFMLQGNGNQDSFQVALQGTNILSLETSLIQTNVTLNSGLINVSQYAGRKVELFLGIVGGTSTNAALTASDFQFYGVLPPSLQIQLSGTNVVLTWPVSAAGYVLQSANQLVPPIAWTTVTNEPVIVNFQYTVTNQIFSGSRFYRLAIIAAPALQAQVAGKNFILSWPTNATGYVLQTTTNLAAANSWTAVTNTPATVNQQSVVTNQISGSARFYRLKE
jgi:pimeloyl-ACP methyl ester carboxylesterase